MSTIRDNFSTWTKVHSNAVWLRDVFRFVRTFQFLFVIRSLSLGCRLSHAILPLFTWQTTYHQIYNTIYPFAMVITVKRFFSPDVFMCFGLNIRLICFMNKNFTLCLRLYQCCVNFISPAGFIFSSFNSWIIWQFPAQQKSKMKEKNKRKTKKMKYAKEITPKTQNAVYLILNARHLNITLSSSRVIVSQSLLLGANNQLTSCCIVSLKSKSVCARGRCFCSLMLLVSQLNHKCY